MSACLLSLQSSLCSCRLHEAEVSSRQRQAWLDIPVKYVGEGDVQQTVVLESFSHCPPQKLEVFHNFGDCKHSRSSQQTDFESNTINIPDS